MKKKRERYRKETDQTMDNKKIKISDVAREAGVGNGTVDRVIHNRGRVAEETRQRVLATIERLHYKPNKAARMLAKKDIYRIAVIYHDKEKDFWDEVSRGIDRAEGEYGEMGVEIHRFILPEVDIKEQLKLLNRAIEERFDGIAVVPYASQDIRNAIDRAMAAGIPVVTFNNDEKCGRLCFVGQDLYHSGRTAGKLMSMTAKQGAGYAVIVPIASAMSALDERAAGFQDVVKSLRPDMRLKGVYNFEQNDRLAYDITKSLLSNLDIDAIYVSNIFVENVAAAVEDAGMKERILLVGHDISPKIEGFLKSGVISATIGQEPELQGYLSVEILCKLLLLDEKPSQDACHTRIEIFLDENYGF